MFSKSRINELEKQVEDLEGRLRVWHKASPEYLRHYADSIEKEAEEKEKREASLKLKVGREVLFAQCYAVIAKSGPTHCELFVTPHKVATPYKQTVSTALVESLQDWDYYHQEESA